MLEVRQTNTHRMSEPRLIDPVADPSAASLRSGLDPVTDDRRNRPGVRLEGKVGVPFERLDPLVADRGSALGTGG